MPVYEYKCKVCDEQFEIEQSFSDDTLTTLDGCSTDDSGQHQLKKVFRAVGISFKGDGFYRNDSRSSSSGTSGSSSAGSSDSNKSTSSKSDSDSSSKSSDSTDTAATKSSSSKASKSSTDSSKAST